MNTGVVHSGNSTAGNQFLNGSGVINTATFIGSGGGTVEFSNGVLNVSGSVTIGRLSVPTAPNDSAAPSSRIRAR